MTSYDFAGARLSWGLNVSPGTWIGNCSGSSAGWSLKISWRVLFALERKSKMWWKAAIGRRKGMFLCFLPCLDSATAWEPQKTSSILPRNPTKTPQNEKIKNKSPKFTKQKYNPFYSPLLARFWPSNTRLPPPAGRRHALLPRPLLQLQRHGGRLRPRRGLRGGGGGAGQVARMGRWEDVMSEKGWKTSGSFSFFGMRGVFFWVLK